VAVEAPGGFSEHLIYNTARSHRLTEMVDRFILSHMNRALNILEDSSKTKVNYIIIPLNKNHALCCVDKILHTY